MEMLSGLFGFGASNSARADEQPVPVSPASPRGGARRPAVPVVGTEDSDSDDGTSQSVRSLRFQVTDNDVVRYWLGAWKRTLEWRRFGGSFEHMRESNTVVLIEEVRKLESEIGVRHLRWSFGKTLQRGELRSGYVMKCTSVSRLNETAFEWQYAGALCTGRFMASAGVAVLNFWTKTACITVMYRLLDNDSMAVSIVEVDDKKEASIQYGTMFRLDTAAYAHLPSS